jgi:hypothetical protein
VMEPGLYTVDRYRALQNFDAYAIIIQQETSQSGWAKWENEVIEKGVEFGIIPMSDTARILVPHLGQKAVLDDANDHNPQISLSSKANGGGLTVYGRGWRWRPGRITKTGRTVGGTFRPRALENFDTEHRSNYAERGGDDAPGLQHDIDSGDWAPEEN